MILFPNGIQGLSDTKWQGVQGSAHRLVGIDYRSEPGAIKVHQKLTEDDTGVVDELCKVPVAVSDGSNLWFSSTSGKVWREVAGVYTLIHTILPQTGFDIETTATTTKNKTITTQVNTPDSVCFKADGTIMYVLCNATVSGNSGEIFQYTLSTAWDVSTATYATKTFVADANSKAMFMKADGTAFWVAEDNGGTSVIQYNLGTPWDISTASAAGVTFNFSAKDSRAYGLSFKSDGTKMIIFGITNNKAYQYNLGTPWDVSTAVFSTEYAFATGFLSATADFDGEKLYIVTSTLDSTIQQYSVGTAWDLTTTVDNGITYNIANQRYFALAFAHDGSGFYISNQDTIVYQYSLGPADANVIALGAEEFTVPNDADIETSYIYVSLQGILRRIPVADIASAWGNNLEYVAYFLNGDDTYHPMQKQNNRLYIGDKYCLAEVNEFGVVTLETDFNVKAPERITTLVDFDTDVLVGTKEPTKAWVKRWDTESLSWYAQDDILETEIRAFLKDDNYVYAIAGDFGRMYFYDGEKLLPHTRIPGSYSPTSKMKVNSKAVGNHMGIPVFGVSSLEGNAVWQGIYSYGRFSKDYNITLDLSYPLSCDEFFGVEIGCILVDGADMFVAWKKGDSVGIDKLDWTLKYESAIIESTTLNGAKDRSKFKSIDNIVADYIEMPTDTSIELSVSNNYGGFIDQEPNQVVDAKLAQIRMKQTIKELGSVQVLIEFNVSGNETPKIENFLVNFAGEQNFASSQEVVA